MTTSAIPVFSSIESRVLGVLIEKQKTVPDSYPMTLNSLVTGCNQKSSRDPVMNVSEAEVLSALDQLKSMDYVMESSGGRVMRYSHNFGRVLKVPAESVSLLAMLMLRGPQTAGELRLNCERLQHFVDISSVEGFLNELAERSTGALVIELPRQAGTRENRWMHLLSGPINVETLIANRSNKPSDDVVVNNEIAMLKEDVANLESEVTKLKTIVTKICTELGIEIPQ